ncbi:MAG: T9SS type A sorting domain-containing protein [Flavobacteriales bacterium]|nr:T9SS type A sorting domain-containing protein [Flavobacteriales bacterium]
MIKHLLLFSALAFTFSASLAQITNGGFENWTSGPGSCESLTDWGTLNANTYLVGICTTQKESSNVHGGSNALKLVTQHVQITLPPVDEMAPGICTNGTINTQTQAVDGGDPFTARPTAFTGWYRADPVNSDTYSFSALLINETTGDTVGSAEWSGNTVVSSWTQFSAPVTYYSADSPTLVQILLLSSNTNNPQENSVVYFDDLDYETITVGIAEEDIAAIQVYPNPVVSDVTFNLGKLNGGKLIISNIMGQRVYDQQLNASQNVISMDRFTNGTYIYRLTDLDGAFLKTGKIILAR